MPEEWIVIRTEVFRDAPGRDGFVEHTAEGDPIDTTGMDAKPDDAACKLIHDDEYPVAL